MSRKISTLFSVVVGMYLWKMMFSIAAINRFQATKVMGNNNEMDFSFDAPGQRTSTQTIVSGNFTTTYSDLPTTESSSSSSSSSSSNPQRALPPPPPPPPLQSTPLGDHPHAGAKDPTGKYYGYVHNPKVLRSPHNKKNKNKKNKNKNTLWEFSIRDPSEREMLCAPLGYGPERWNKSSWNERNLGFDESQAIFGDIVRVVDLVKNDVATDSTTAVANHETTANDDPDNIQVFCAIYTYPGNDHQADAIRQTWGKRCDGFMAASTVTDPQSATVNLPHKAKIAKQGSYEGIWQRVRSMVGYIYDNFLEEYDFYYFCGDDTYLIVENLKALLLSPRFVEQAGGRGYPKPVYTGTWIHPFWKLTPPETHDPSFYYMGGGSGYVLNRQALKLLVEKALPDCYASEEFSAEDVLMGVCLLRYLNVTGVDSRDDEGRERFFWNEVVSQSMVRKPRIRKERDVLAILGNFVRFQQDWNLREHGWEPKYGPHDMVSPTAIAFHRVIDIAMKRYERLFYRSKRRDPKLHRRDCG